MKKRSGMKFIAKADCDCGEIRLAPHGNKILVVCPCMPPRTLDLRGNYKQVDISWQYKSGD